MLDYRPCERQYERKDARYLCYPQRKNAAPKGGVRLDREEVQVNPKGSHGRSRDTVLLPSLGIRYKKILSGIAGMLTRSECVVEMWS